MKKVVATSLTVGTFLLSASTVLADASNININAQSAGFQITDLGVLINSLLKITLGIVGLLVFIYLIWGGIEWITAGGDKSKTESARTKLTNAIIGLAIVAAAFAVSQVLGTFFGINVGSNIVIPKPY